MKLPNYHKLELLLLTFITASATSCFAQNSSFAIIQDPDGFTNIRYGKTKKIVDKLLNNQVFAIKSVVDTDGWQDWYWISFPGYDLADQKFMRHTATREGMIHKSRIKYLNDLPQWKQEKVSAEWIRFTNGKDELSLRFGQFIKADHEYITAKNGNIIKIDAEEPFGIDGKLHEDILEIKSIAMQMKGNKISFPRPMISNLLSSTKISSEINVAQAKDGTVFLHMQTGRGYQVVWTIQKNKVTSQFCYRDH